MSPWLRGGAGARAVGEGHSCAGGWGGAAGKSMCLSFSGINGQCLPGLTKALEMDKKFASLASIHPVTIFSF